MWCERDGTLVVEGTSQQQYESVQKLESLGGSKLTYVHPTLNVTKGVVTTYRFREIGYTIEELKFNLKDQNVTEIYHIVRNIGGVSSPTNTYIITFATAHLPTEIFCGSEKYEVRPYLSRPRRCHNCNMYGHVRTKCKRQSSCVTCGQTPTHEDCTNSECCSNCGGPHAASSTNCMMYLFENDVLALRDTERISFQDARRQVKNRFVKPGITFAAALTSNRTFSKQVQKSSNASNKTFTRELPVTEKNTTQKSPLPQKGKSSSNSPSKEGNKKESTNHGKLENTKKPRTGNPILEKIYLSPKSQKSTHPLPEDSPETINKINKFISDTKNTSNLAKRIKTNDINNTGQTLNNNTLTSNQYASLDDEVNPNLDQINVEVDIHMDAS
ncbi:unnamed protein product [Rotaria magnacalcarata]|uniref:CCHC-type domain-containing protein n=1 Tax=Rotaria magnacalcarata TaxID=392030 RepID=A0A816MQV5_9BILA|nr:unnamed protein product [Rotaria magnacalcarata]CAF4124434.1 unnamed protein product [Rotaria magnacalcarata]